MELLKIYLNAALFTCLALLACGAPAALKIKDSIPKCTWLQGGGDFNRAAFVELATDSVPKLLWTRQLKTALLLEPTAALGVMILPTANHRFDIVAASDGAYLGEVKSGGSLVSPCGLEDSMVAMNEFGQRLRIRNWITNQIAWQVDLNNMTLEPLIMLGKIYWFDGDKLLNCYDLKEGKRIWDKRLDDGLAAPLGATLSRMLVTSGKDEIDCISPDSGKAIWSHTVSSRVRNAPVLYDSSVIISTVDGDIIKLSATDGNEIWTSNLNAGVFAPLATDGKGIYVGTNDGQLVRLNYETGKVDWKISTASPIKAGITVAGNLVVMAGLDHHIYFVEKNLGKTVLDYKTKGMITARPIVCMNRVYVAGEDKCLYCFQMTKEE
jgi:outer membrane protein assembly factor BamB